LFQDEDDFAFGEPSTLSNEDAFELYLTQPTERSCMNPLSYWHKQQTANLVPASLARMAKDYLSCPGSYFNILFIWKLMY
jgi:hypothetical protein